MCPRLQTYAASNGAKTRNANLTIPQEGKVQAEVAPPVRAVLYARSASEVRSAPAARATEQMVDLRRYAGMRGLLIIEEIIDAAISGNRFDRPGMLAVLELASRDPRAFDILVIQDHSRIARDVATYLRIKDALAAAGIQIEVCIHWIDSTWTP